MSKDLPPGCIPEDFVGASHDAFLVFFDHPSVTADGLKRHLRELFVNHGLTNNQRSLLTDACEMAAREFHEPLTVDIKNCQRCGLDHDRLVFRSLDNARGKYTRWATCPAKEQPILLALVEGFPRA